MKSNKARNNRNQLNQGKDFGVFPRPIRWRKTKPLGNKGPETSIAVKDTNQTVTKFQ